MEKFLNEFRRDLVSGNWVLFATQRRKRHRERKYQDSYQPKDGCPFENPRASGQEIVKFYPSEKNWFIALIKNKYPAVRSGVCGPLEHAGPFDVYGGFGFHEIVITRNHDKDFSDFAPKEIEDVFKVFRERYKEISHEKCGEYISIFHNHGKEAGATIYHPHSQILSTPILPPDVMRSIKGSEEFYKKKHKKVHDLMIEWEIKQKKRIIEENEKFLAFCPFVSTKPYEVRIFPKRSSSHFENISDKDLSYLTSLLQSILQRINKVLKKPPYNFFIHTAPVKEDLGMVSSEYYHWHMEVIPHLTIDAGFEISTGIDVNIVDPDEVAEELRSVEI